MELNANNIYFKYTITGDWILNNMTLSLKSNQIIGLVGPSGCGKSTLGKIIANQLKPWHGCVYLDGKALPENGFCPIQLIYQHPELAVNPKWKLRKTLQEAGNYDDELRKLMGIKESFLERWPNELSGGELQRICVMRALKPQTRFLICDEISTMLDVITQSQIWDIVISYSKQHNIGVLVITHNKHLANAICDRIINLH